MQPNVHPINEKHGWLERRPIWFVAMVTVAVSIGGLVEMIPLFKLQQGGQASAVEAKAAALVKPRQPLAMVRPFRHETKRYGNYSLAADAQYDHPYQYGSRRIGPDLARLGGKYPDAWHYQHLKDPQSMVPGSLMPRYTWLESSKVDPTLTQAKMRAQRMVGVPYTDQEIADAPKAVLDKTEADALVAYLQTLGAATKDLDLSKDQEEKTNVVRR